MIAVGWLYDAVYFPEPKMANNDFKKILKLIKEERLRDSTSGKRGILIASESDKGRVINSVAFRHLQQKAQVFPLEPNAAVRTRLTHSIEVAQIGRYIAQKIIEKHQAAENESYNELAAFVNIIETACLLHDIGNPPFGHLGEAAIRDWFSAHHYSQDFLNFDGNPQGFRIAAFLSGADDYGFNLTCTLLLSMLKYPFTSEDKAVNEKIGKIGIFIAELDKYQSACDKLNWQPKHRFPFARLMDAADDIAYSMSDLEDGLEKGIISIDDLKKEFGGEQFRSGAVEPFIGFKTKIINDAVNIVSDTFVSSIDTILQGGDVELLDSANDVGALVKVVNRYAAEYIYTHESAEQVELAGRSAISGLLTHFGALLRLSEQDFSELISENVKVIKQKQLDFHIRLLRRIPPSYRKKYLSNQEVDESTRRAHLVVDFISGMTDDFALETYQILEGIRIR